MSFNTPPEVGSDYSASVNNFWRAIDERITTIVQTIQQTKMGIPRARTMSLNIPLASDTESPVAGWLQSVIIFNTCRITSWEIHALTSGTVTLDLRVSHIPSSPATVPTLTSLPGSSHYLSLNGYATSQFDTSNWDQRDIQAGSVLHVYVISAASIRQAILGIQLMDLFGKVLQI